MGDMGCLVAPRKPVVVNGAQDSIFLRPGVDNSYALIKEAYEAAGVPENCEPVTGPAGHRFYADLSWLVVHKMMSD